MGIFRFHSIYVTLGTRGFSRVRREFSVLAEGRHIFGRRPKPRAGHDKDLTETGNRARKVSGAQGDFMSVPTVKSLIILLMQLAIFLL